VVLARLRTSAGLSLPLRRQLQAAVAGERGAAATTTTHSKEAVILLPATPLMNLNIPTANEFILNA
jgi:hypothetical protein